MVFQRSTNCPSRVRRGRPRFGDPSCRRNGCRLGIAGCCTSPIGRNCRSPRSLSSWGLSRRSVRTNSDPGPPNTLRRTTGMTSDWPAGVHRLMHTPWPMPARRHLHWTRWVPRRAPPTQPRSRLALAGPGTTRRRHDHDLSDRRRGALGADDPRRAAHPDQPSAVPATARGGPRRGDGPSAPRPDRSHHHLRPPVRHSNTPKRLFSTITVDVYADLAGRRWKNIVTYPNSCRPRTRRRRKRVLPDRAVDPRNHPERHPQVVTNGRTTRSSWWPNPARTTSTPSPGR